jgi:hypothetical protein
VALLTAPAEGAGVAGACPAAAEAGVCHAVPAPV